MGRRKIRPDKQKESSTMVGTVSGCKLLNLRSGPKNDAAVKRILPLGTTVEIETAGEVPGDFYQVYTVDGDVGYCMKKFITISE